VVWYTGQFYALFYMTTVLKISYVTVYIVMMIAMTAAAPFFIVFGALSDRVGRRNIMTAGFALAVVTFWPVFTLFDTFKDNPVVLTVLVFYLVILVTMVYGPIAAFLVALFPTNPDRLVPQATAGRGLTPARCVSRPVCPYADCGRRSIGPRSRPPKRCRWKCGTSWCAAAPWFASMR